MSTTTSRRRGRLDNDEATAGDCMRQREAKRRIHMGTFRHKTRVHSGTFRYIRVHSRHFDSFTSHWRPRKRWEMSIHMGSFSATTSAFYKTKRGQGKQGRRTGARQEHEWEGISRNLPCSPVSLSVYVSLFLALSLSLSLSLSFSLSLSLSLLSNIHI